MIFIKRFLLIIQFLTTIPCARNLGMKQEDFGEGLVFAPLVGLILGGILGLCYYGLGFIFPKIVVSAFIMIIYIILTGGLHIDGLGDSFDGLFSNRPKEKILEIMRDSRVGVNAVLAIFCVLLLDILFLSELDAHVFKVLLLLPVAGRIGLPIGAGFSVNARDDGLGKCFIEFCGMKEMAAATVLYLLIFVAIAGLKGLLPALVPLVTSVLFVKFLSRKIGGATGDILGAVCELNQLVFLCMAYLMQRVT